MLFIPIFRCNSRGVVEPPILIAWMNREFDRPVASCVLGSERSAGCATNMKAAYAELLQIR
jgi:hypothetical protein